MGHRANKLSGCIPRQLSIGIERNDVLDRGKNRDSSDDFGKAIARTATKQGVKLRKLSAFAFVTHPQSFAGVPTARAVQKEKEVLFTGRIFAVQDFDSGTR